MEEIIELLFTKPEGRLQHQANGVPFYDKNDVGFTQNLQLVLDRNKAYQQAGHGSYYTHYMLGAFLLFVQTDLKDKLGIDQLSVKIEKDNLKVAALRQQQKELLLYTFNLEDLPPPDLSFTNLEFAEIFRKMELNQNDADDFSIKHRIFGMYKPEDGEKYFSFADRGFYESIASDDSVAILSSKLKTLPRKSQNVGQLKKAIFYNPDYPIKDTFVDINRVPENDVHTLIPKLIESNVGKLEVNLKEIFRSFVDLYKYYDAKFKSLSQDKSKHMKIGNEEACQGFIQGGLELNFKQKLDLNFEIGDLHLYIASRMNFEKNWRLNDIPIALKIATLENPNFDDETTHKEMLEEWEKGGISLPMFLSKTPVKEMLLAVVNFRAKISTVAVKRFQTVLLPGLVKALIEKANKFRSDFLVQKQQNADNEEAVREWLKTNKRYFVENIKDNYLNDCYMTKIDDASKGYFASRFVLGQMLSTEHIYNEKVRKFIYFHSSTSSDKQITSFILKKDTDNFGINLNIIETTNSDLDMRKMELEIPSPQKHAVTEMLTINMKFTIQKKSNVADSLSSRHKYHYLLDIEVKELTQLNEPIRKTKPFLELKTVYLDNVLLKQSPESSQIFLGQLKAEIKSMFMEFPGCIKNQRDLEAIMKGLFVYKAKVASAYSEKMPIFTVIPFDSATKSAKKSKSSIVPIVIQTDFIEDLKEPTISTKESHNHEHVKAYVMNQQSLARVNEKMMLLNVLVRQNVNTGENRIVMDVHPIEISFHDAHINLPSTSGCTAGIRRKRASELCKLLSESESMQKSDAYKSNAKLLARNVQIFRYMTKIGSFSSKGMYAMMGKNMLLNMAHDDCKDVAINLGFLASGELFSKWSQIVFLKGLEISEQKLLLGNMLKAAAPFLAKVTSAFIIYDLVNNVKNYHNNTEALVSIISDSIFLASDVLEIGVTLGEAFGLAEGISAITGPLGMAINFAVLVGTDIYFAAKRVNEIDKVVHLHLQEKFRVGIRALLGIEPEKYLLDLVNRKEATQLVYDNIASLLEKTEIAQSYVFPTAFVNNICTIVPKGETWGGGVIFPNIHGLSISAARVPVNVEQCSHKLVFEPDNHINLWNKFDQFEVSRMTPSSSQNNEILCYPLHGDNEEPKRNIYCWLALLNAFFLFGCNLMSDPPIVVKNAYACGNATGIESIGKKSIYNYTIIHLGDGKDFAYGRTDAPNIFIAKSGHKRIYGGPFDDKFILEHDPVSGSLNGGGGMNTLDLTNFLSQGPELKVEVDLHFSKLNVTKPNGTTVTRFTIRNINQLLGRLYKPDIIYCGCQTKHISSQGGLKEAKRYDIIILEDIMGACYKDVSLKLDAYTVVFNHALTGRFWYILPFYEGRVFVDLHKSAPDAQHNFIFNVSLNHLKRAKVKKIKRRGIDQIKFRTKNASIIIRFTDKNNNVNTVFRFGDNTELARHRNNFIAVQNTSKSVKDIIGVYKEVAHRLKILIVSYSRADNATVVIGHDQYYRKKRHNRDHVQTTAMIMHNDPMHETHIVAGPCENLFVIKPASEDVNVLYHNILHAFIMPKIIIHDLAHSNFTDTIDLTRLANQLKVSINTSIKLEVKARKDRVNDIGIKLYTEKDNFHLTTVILKHAMKNNRYANFIIINKLPLKIGMNYSSVSIIPTPYLYPVPITFKNDTHLMIVSENDVLENHVITIEKSIGNFTYSRLDDDLIVSNAWNCTGDDENCATLDSDDSQGSQDFTMTTMLFQNFYKHQHMHSMTLKFLDQQISMEKEHQLIQQAEDFMETVEKSFNQYWERRRMLDFDEQWNQYVYDAAYARMASRIRSGRNDV